MSTTIKKPVSAAPEVRLVVLCTRPVLDESSHTEIEEILAGAPDWSEIARWADWHQVVPLVRKRLENDYPGYLPPYLARKWSTDCDESARYAHRQFEELIALVELFASHDIPIIPYKGPALALQLYNDIALRPCRDLDFIIHDYDLDHALEILCARGYLSGSLQARSPKQAKYLCTYYGQWDLRHPDLEIDIEPHWKLTPWVLAADLDEEGLWSRAVNSKLAEQPCLSLSKEDQIIVLGTHGSKELWNRLKSLSDIARFVTCVSDIDWEVALNRARQLGVLRMVLIGLLGAERILGTPISPQVEEHITADKALLGLVEDVERWTFVEPRVLPSLSRPCSFRTQMREKFVDRARFLARTMLAPNRADFDAWSLPDRFFFLYYFLRTVDVFAVEPVRRLFRRLVYGT